jgi:hypothetical protein
MGWVAKTQTALRPRRIPDVESLFLGDNLGMIPQPLTGKAVSPDFLRNRGANDRSSVRKELSSGCGLRATCRGGVACLGFFMRGTRIPWFASRTST